MSSRFHNALACLAACVGLAGAARAESAVDPSRQLIEQIGVSPQLGQRVPLDAEFVDADGRRVKLADLLGRRPVILHLVYYECPMLCKLSSDGLLRALETLTLRPGHDFAVVTLSFDPREGPQLSAGARQMAIARYGREPVERGWTFLTGDAANIARVCESVGFRYAWDDATSQYAHAAGVFVLAPDGTISRFLSGVEFSPRDLRLAIFEASAGKVGTAADQVLLMCYMYDPTTGKYGFAVMTAIRAAGVATVALLAASIVVMLRHERKGALTSALSLGKRE